MAPVASFSEIIAQKFPYKPTTGQTRFFSKMENFLNQKRSGPEKNCFILKGFAGTGKTTVISALIKSLPKFGLQSVLLAPTGRAAKVMSAYAHRKAMTIHKKIYKQTDKSQSGRLAFRRMPNNYTNTLFIVDEASMISDEGDFGNKSLLHDIIAFVYESPTNMLMFVGDLAQLPPVGKLFSPALEIDTLSKQFGLAVHEELLTEVMRQEETSGILFNATALRNQVDAKPPVVGIATRNFGDLFKMTGAKMEDGLRYAYDKYGQENTIVVTRSNRAAVLYNQFIRRTILFSEEEIDAGDRLMIVKNNYTVLGDDSSAGFLANGDFVELMKIRRFEEVHGFRFANATLRLTDDDEQPSFEAKIFIDTLHSHSPSITPDDYKKLYDSVLQEYADMPNKTERQKAIRSDPYLNALQVKFSYALTCHKAQGGQWSAVFIDQGYLKEEQVNAEFIRWLYTALTRATEEVFLLNFRPDFFAD